MLRFLVLLRRAIWRTFQHDGFATAKAAAYSSILSLFPAFLVIASVMAAAHGTEAAMRQISYAIGRVLPPGSVRLALTYFDTANQRPVRVIFSASSVMITAATGVIVSWMAGFRRAYGIQTNPWGWYKERAMALLLIPLSLIPMAFATFLVAFGQNIENWMSAHTLIELRWALLLLWRGARWAIATLTSIGVIALIYHVAIPRTQSWRRVLPGAMLATLMWFPATLAFGWYVTRFANYNAIYGPMGAAIALLVWLYMISIVILIGAEFNALIFPKREM